MMNGIKYYQAGKSPNLRTIFQGDFVEVALFKETVETFVINYHNNIMDAIEVEKTREDKDWICECFRDCFRGNQG